MNEFTIRPARRDDIDAILAIENKVFSGDRLSRRSLNAFAASPRRPLLAASSGGDLAGYALVVLREGSTVARLYSIAVDPRFARRGLGAALLAASEAYAQRRRRRTLRLEVRSDNTGAIRLYEASGYRRLGAVADYYEDGGEALRLEKALGSPTGDSR